MIFDKLNSSEEREFKESKGRILAQNRLNKTSYVSGRKNKSTFSPFKVLGKPSQMLKARNIISIKKVTDLDLDLDSESEEEPHRNTAIRKRSEFHFYLNYTYKNSSKPKGSTTDRLIEGVRQRKTWKKWTDDLMGLGEISSLSPFLKRSFVSNLLRNYVQSLDQLMLTKAGGREFKLMFEYLSVQRGYVEQFITEVNSGIDVKIKKLGKKKGGKLAKQKLDLGYVLTGKVGAQEEGLFKEFTLASVKDHGDENGSDYLSELNHPQS
jgi:hypothetical protein